MRCPECNGRGETIYFVETDRDEYTVTVEQRKGICRTCNGSGEKHKTNADRIRAMTDEELADWALNKADVIGREWNDSYLGLIKWLQQPAEGE